LSVTSSAAVSPEARLRSSSFVHLEAVGSACSKQKSHLADECLLVHRSPVKPSVERVTAGRHVRGCVGAVGVGFVVVRAGARAYFGPRPGVGSRAGDMMFDGVIPLGEALRPLDLSRPSTGEGGGSTRREPAAAHLCD
jgi:hypothetical protein